MTRGSMTPGRMPGPGSRRKARRRLLASMPAPVSISSANASTSAAATIPVSKGPHAFWCYDLETNAWVDLKPKGKPCKGCNRYGPNHAIMNYDSANDVVVLIFHRWQMAPTDGDVQPGPESRGVYVYDPAANSWTENPLPMPRAIGQLPQWLL